MKSYSKDIMTKQNHKKLIYLLILSFGLHIVELVWLYVLYAPK